MDVQFCSLDHFYDESLTVDKLLFLVWLQIPSLLLPTFHWGWVMESDPHKSCLHLQITGWLVVRVRLVGVRFLGPSQSGKNPPLVLRPGRNSFPWLCLSRFRAWEVLVLLINLMFQEGKTWVALLRSCSCHSRFTQCMWFRTFVEGGSVILPR